MGLVLLLGGILGLGLWAAESSGSQAEPAPEQMVLRLGDLPLGFMVGDDSGCGSRDTEGAEPAVSEWIVKYRPTGCEFEYERLYALPGPDIVPPLVESSAIALPDRSGAVEGMALSPTLARERSGRRTAAREVAAPELGEEARLFQGGHGSILFWRQGSILASLTVVGGAPEINDRVVARLAAVQERRIESPTPYTGAERNDSQVPLDDPHLKLPVYWLGTSFAPGRGLPEASLGVSSVTLGRGEAPPGQKLELGYAPGPRLATWTQAGWRKYRRSVFGRTDWTRSCSRPTRTALDGVRSVVVGVHLRRTGPSVFGEGPKAPKPCPGAPPNHFFAVAHLGRVVVGVDLTLCYTCAEPHAGPYDSRRVMIAVLRGLRLRPNSR